MISLEKEVVASSQTLMGFGVENGKEHGNCYLGFRGL